MRDKSHLEQVERWARFFKKNPEIARKQLNNFIDAQITKSKEFYIRLFQAGKGDKIKRLKNRI